jgi:adenylate kinase family enzyme
VSTTNLTAFTAPGQRTVVIGSSGSGKTTLARRLAQLLKVPHVELDALHWEPNWMEAPLEVFRERTATALNGDRWVVDGNYSKVRDILWVQADTIIWLDYPLGQALGRLVKRTFRRVVLREELWNGNRETLSNALIPRADNIFVWTIKRHHHRRREYPELFARPEFSHLKVIRLLSAKATDAWLEKLESLTPVEA